MKTKILIAVLLINGFIYAQDTRFDSLITAGVDQIYSIKFAQAQQTFSIVQKEYPNHPAGKFFTAMIDWWKILIDLDNESMDDKFYDKLDEVIDQCDDLLDKNPNNVDALFFKGGSLGFEARLLAIRESWFKAALDGKDALPLVYKAYELDPKNVDVQLGFGIYNYYAEVIPQKYPVVKPFMAFFPSGNKEKGLKQLENVAYNGKYAKIESRYFLMTLNFQYEENYAEALKYGKMLIEQFPDNPQFERYYGAIYVRKNDYTSAVKIFRDVLDKCNKGLTGYNERARREANYYIGQDYMNRNIADSAKTYFSKSEQLSRKIDDDEPSGFLLNAVLYLGMLNDQLGNRAEAIKYYKEVLDMKDRGDNHKKAEQYLKTPYKK